MNLPLAIALLTVLLMFMGLSVSLFLDVRKTRRDMELSEAQTLRAIGLLNELKADAARWRWLAEDVDEDARDDFIRWLGGHVASRAEVDAECDRMMDTGYRSPQA